jgi:hypothetical protein
MHLGFFVNGSQMRCQEAKIVSGRVIGKCEHVYLLYEYSLMVFPDPLLTLKSSPALAVCYLTRDDSRRVLIANWAAHHCRQDFAK